MSDTATTKMHDPLPISTGTKDRLDEALSRLPFRTHLSFEPLFDELESLAGGAGDRHAEAAALVRSLKDVPALRGSIEDTSALDAHPDAVRTLMGFVVPELMDDQAIVRAYAPFAPASFFTTSSFRRTFGAQGVEISLSNGEVKREYYRENMLFAYLLLFHKHYGVSLPHGTRVKKIRDTKTGLDRFFVHEGSMRFVQVSPGSTEVLPQAEYQRLIDMQDLAELERRMPLDDVTFSGFLCVRHVDITELHNLSLLKSELVEPNALQSPDRIFERLRSIVGFEDLDVGVVLRYESSNNHRHCNNRSLLRCFEGCMASMEGSVYEQVVESGQPQFFPHLDEYEGNEQLLALLQGAGFKSLGLLPLVEDERVIAILELGSRTPGRIHNSVAGKLGDLLVPLAVAARREMDEAESAIERTIKANCTAIHPSVEWRFEEAAYHYSRDVAEHGTAAFEDIIFENVYPLFGAMDIRGSSDSRNHSIEADLLEHLDLARKTMRAIYAAHPMPLADYYDTALARFRESVAAGLSSGDEIKVIEFLNTRIESFLEYVRENVDLQKDADDHTPVDAYFARMDPSLRILYQRRKQYEDSVNLINDTLGQHLDEEQEKAQAIFPHYFEKFKTDGVEYNIYVGGSMAREGFGDVQLKNLRLWQLRVMCESARIAERLVDQMEVPLKTTPLVLVQSTPLTIQFSAEEKQFVVEGSYNIRYAIMKKRIDKSTIRGTGERLTQPGVLAVIYSHDKEHDEYYRYMEYLSDKGYLAPEIESHDLDDMQGVSGLRALRARILMD